MSNTGLQEQQETQAHAPQWLPEVPSPRCQQLEVQLTRNKSSVWRLLTETAKPSWEEQPSCPLVTNPSAWLHREENEQMARVHILFVVK